MYPTVCLICARKKSRISAITSKARKVQRQLPVLVVVLVSFTVAGLLTRSHIVSKCHRQGFQVCLVATYLNLLAVPYSQTVTSIQLIFTTGHHPLDSKEFEVGLTGDARLTAQLGRQCHGYAKGD